jgi:hypothetical protein
VGGKAIKMIEERDQVGMAMRPDDKCVIYKLKPTFGFEMKLLKAKDSKCSINILATTRDKDDPMVVPLVYSWQTPLKVKKVEERQILIRLRVSRSTSLEIKARASENRSSSSQLTSTLFSYILILVECLKDVSKPHKFLPSIKCFVILLSKFVF